MNEPLAHFGTLFVQCNKRIRGFACAKAGQLRYSVRDGEIDSGFSNFFDERRERFYGKDRSRRIELWLGLFGSFGAKESEVIQNNCCEDQRSGPVCGQCTSDSHGLFQWFLNP